MVKGNSLNDETLNADAVMDEEMEKNHFVLAWNHICTPKTENGSYANQSYGLQSC